MQSSIGLPQPIKHRYLEYHYTKFEPPFETVSDSRSFIG